MSEFGPGSGPVWKILGKQKSSKYFNNLLTNKKEGAKMIFRNKDIDDMIFAEDYKIHSTK